jgi:hypothetical protein
MSFEAFKNAPKLSSDKPEPFAFKSKPPFKPLWEVQKADGTVLWTFASQAEATAKAQTIMNSSGEYVMVVAQQATTKKQTPVEQEAAVGEVLANALEWKDIEAKASEDSELDADDNFSELAKGLLSDEEDFGEDTPELVESQDPEAEQIALAALQKEEEEAESDVDEAIQTLNSLTADDDDEEEESSDVDPFSKDDADAYPEPDPPVLYMEESVTYWSVKTYYEGALTICSVYFAEGLEGEPLFDLVKPFGFVAREHPVAEDPPFTVQLDGIYPKAGQCLAQILDAEEGGLLVHLDSLLVGDFELWKQDHVLDLDAGTASVSLTFNLPDSWSCETAEAAAKSLSWMPEGTQVSIESEPLNNSESHRLVVLLPDLETGVAPTITSSLKGFAAQLKKGKVKYLADEWKKKAFSSVSFPGSILSAVMSGTPLKDALPVQVSLKQLNDELVSLGLPQLQEDGQLIIGGETYTVVPTGANHQVFAKPAGEPLAYIAGVDYSHSPGTGTTTQIHVQVSAPGLLPAFMQRIHADWGTEVIAADAETGTNHINIEVVGLWHEHEIKAKLNRWVSEILDEVDSVGSSASALVHDQVLKDMIEARKQALQTMLLPKGVMTKSLLLSEKPAEVVTKSKKKSGDTVAEIDIAPATPAESIDFELELAKKPSPKEIESGLKKALGEYVSEDTEYFNKKLYDALGLAPGGENLKHEPLATVRLHLLPTPTESSDLVFSLGSGPNSDEDDEHPRTIVVGDLHGCIDELYELLNDVGFNPGMDRLISVGDVLDRGPNPIGVLRLFQGLGAEVVRGNHEDKYLRYWKHLKKPKKYPKPHMTARHMAMFKQLTFEDFEFMETWPTMIDLGKFDHVHGRFVVVHAGMEPALPVKDQNPKHLMNTRWVDSAGHFLACEPGTLEKPEGGIRWTAKWLRKENVIYGHSVRSLEDVVIEQVQMKSKSNADVCGTTYGLDTGCVYGGRLSALILPDMKVVQVQAQKQYVAPILDLAG